MRIAMIGGDLRMLSAAYEFADSGDIVYAVGFDKHEPDDRVISCVLQSIAGICDIAVLPVRPLSGELIFAPYSSEPISIEVLSEVLGDIAVYSGSAASIKPYVKGNVYDYSAREDFCLYNAALTAEGAIALAVNESDRSLLGERILVAGYGRIGRALSRRLSAFGADITVAIRSSTATAIAETDGIKTCGYPIRDIGRYGVIFNTVPAEVITAEDIDSLSADNLIIDLASAPGGLDHGLAGERGLRCVMASGLPGKYSPRSAGRIICNTIQNMIKEGNGG